MEINKKKIEQAQNPPQAPLPSKAPLSQEQKKTNTQGIEILGNASKTSPPELKVNIDTLAIEHMIYFALTPLNQLIITLDPEQCVMIKIGKQNFIKEEFYDVVFPNLEATDEEIMIIPEELWGELNIQIGNLKPLIIAVVSQTSETASAPEKKFSAPKIAPKQAPAPSNQPRVDFTGTSSSSINMQKAMILILDEINKSIKATKERHEREKLDEELAEKHEKEKQEIEKFEQLKTRIKESNTQKEILSYIKDWTESLPPCPIRLLNPLTIQRMLVKKFLFENVLG